MKIKEFWKYYDCAVGCLLWGILEAIIYINFTQRFLEAAVCGWCLALAFSCAFSGWRRRKIEQETEKMKAETAEIRRAVEADLRRQNYQQN